MKVNTSSILPPTDVEQVDICELIITWHTLTQGQYIYNVHCNSDQIHDVKNEAIWMLETVVSLHDTVCSLYALPALNPDVQID